MLKKKVKVTNEMATDIQDEKKSSVEVDGIKSQEAGNKAKGTEETISSAQEENKSYQAINGKNDKGTKYSSNNALSKTNQTRILMEHFGFIPLWFIDDIINSVNDKMYTCLSKFESLLKQIADNPESIEEKMFGIDTLLENAVDKHFDVFELVSLQSVFSFKEQENIPSLHYMGMDLTCTVADEEFLIKELEKEREKLLRMKIMNQNIKRVLQKNEDYLAMIKNYVNASKHLYSLVPANSKPLMSESVEFIKTKYNELREEFEKNSELFKSTYDNAPSLRDLYFQRSLISSVTNIVPDDDDDTPSSLHQVFNINDKRETNTQEIDDILELMDE